MYLAETVTKSVADPLSIVIAMASVISSHTAGIVPSEREKKSKSLWNTCVTCLLEKLPRSTCHVRCVLYLTTKELSGFSKSIII